MFIFVLHLCESGLEEEFWNTSVAARALRAVLAL